MSVVTPSQWHTIFSTYFAQKKMSMSHKQKGLTLKNNKCFQITFNYEINQKYQ